MKKAFKKVPNCIVAVMHGKMTPQEKDEVMKDFKEGKIKILISTTVIEVGVDVENATMMVIFDSFRFGLSALHQLRGRVGRNSLDSYCILLRVPMAPHSVLTLHLHRSIPDCGTMRARDQVVAFFREKTGA